jgi:hypothetical protein
MIHVHFTSSRESSNSNFGFSETFHKQKGINLTPKKAQSTTQHTIHIKEQQFAEELKQFLEPRMASILKLNCIGQWNNLRPACDAFMKCNVRVKENNKKERRRQKAPFYNTGYLSQSKI